MGKIVVVGSYITDVAVYTPRFPKDGETLLGSSVKFGPGGKGSNQATAAHRAGGDVVTVAKIGTDFLGQVALSHYRKEGMSDRYLLRQEDCQTGCAVIEIQEQTAENRIIVTAGANRLLLPEEVPEEEIRSCDVLLLQQETSPEANRQAAILARRYGKTVILNPAPGVEEGAALFPLTDYVTPNETEAAVYTGVSVTDGASARLAAGVLQERGAKNVIITLGKAGAYLKTADTELLIPPYAVKAVDTTGAGDAFNGAFAAALSEGRTAEEAARFASAAAALSVTKRGTSEAMPYRQEVLRLMAEQPV